MRPVGVLGGALAFLWQAITKQREWKHERSEKVRERKLDGLEKQRERNLALRESEREGNLALREKSASSVVQTMTNSAMSWRPLCCCTTT